MTDAGVSWNRYGMCTETSGSRPSTTPGVSPVIHAFKSRAAVAILAASSVFAANAADVTGAGASFIYR